MLLLGIDIGTSAIKIAVIDSQNQQCVASYRYPEKEETPIVSVKRGWAEQSPDMWWDHVKHAILALNEQELYHPTDIGAIGIAYQMHGLVMVDHDHRCLRDAIIWCDSRAVEIGMDAFHALGGESVLPSLLNSPGNFTAAKLSWIKRNEPDRYNKIHKVMLPGDYIAMRLTGEITTSISALSEGVFWDFQYDQIYAPLMSYFGFNHDIIPGIQPVFSEHGHLLQSVAQTLGLTPGIPVSYKAGDQPNNALSLNVFEPGEVAATAGTSGVIYGVSDEKIYDKRSRVNTFAHVNYTPNQPHVGMLLCINGTGILNRWVKDQFGCGLDYAAINEQASRVPIGSEGLRILPFGNGAERMLENKLLGAHMANIDLNKHNYQNIFRACQEGIAFAFRYGLDMMRENNMHPKVIRAGRANLFLSDLFAQIFVDVTGVPIELYAHDGSVGAALGAGIGAGVFRHTQDAFQYTKPLQVIEPDRNNAYEAIYFDWLHLLNKQLS